MRLEELMIMYENERHEKHPSFHQLLDYCQKLYIYNQIDIITYRSLFYYLTVQGAISAFDYDSLTDYVL